MLLFGCCSCPYTSYCYLHSADSRYTSILHQHGWQDAQWAQLQALVQLANRRDSMELAK